MSYIRLHTEKMKYSDNNNKREDRIIVKKTPSRLNSPADNKNVNFQHILQESCQKSLKNNE